MVIDLRDELADAVTSIPPKHFDSYIPHRSGPNRSEQPRRALYITYNRASEGSYREKYYRCKRDVFPPDIERDPKKDYKDSGVFNVGNPIK